MKTRPPNTVRHIDYRVLSILMAITILFGAFPLQAFAKTYPTAIGQSGEAETLGLSGVSRAAEGPTAHDEESLLAAIDSIKNSNTATITLTSDIALASTITFSGSKKITLDGAGFTIYQAAENIRHFHVTSGTLTIRDVTLDGLKDGGGVSLAGSSATFVMESGIIENCGDFTFTRDLQGGAIYSASGHVNIKGGRIQNNCALWGGALYHYSSRQNNTLVIENAVFEDNAVSVTKSAINGQLSYGGAVYAASDVVLEFRNSSFINNTSGYSGGAVHINRGKFLFENTLFDGNTAKQYGGAIHSNSQYKEDYTHILEGCEFTNNSAASGGAVSHGMRNWLVPLKVSGATFTDNTATTSTGGALHIIESHAEIEDTVIEYNTARRGGGIMNRGSTITLRNTSVSHNTASQAGGAVCHYDSYDVKNQWTDVVSGKLVGNESKYGGAVWVGSNFSISSVSAQPTFDISKCNQIMLGADVELRNNQSEESYLILPDHQEVHDTHVKTTAYSNGHTSAYNNDDIFYNAYREWQMTFSSYYGEEIAPIMVRYGDLVPEPEPPTTGNMVFFGWFKDWTQVDFWNFETDRMPDNDHTLYAYWRDWPQKVFVCGADDELLGSFDVFRSDKISVPESYEYKEGHTFVGWYNFPSRETLYDFDFWTMPSADVTLYGKWTINTYEATFDTVGGTTIPPEDVTYGQLVPQPEDPTRGQDTFTGWYRDNSAAIPWDFTTDTMPAGGLTLYAGWEVDDGGEDPDPGNGGGEDPDPGDGGGEDPDPGDGGGEDLDPGDGGGEDPGPGDGGGEDPDPGDGGGEDPGPGDGGGEDPDPGDSGGEDPGPGDGGGEDPDPGDSGGEDPGPGGDGGEGPGDGENPGNEDNSGTTGNTGGSAGGSRGRNGGTSRRDTDPPRTLVFEPLPELEQIEPDAAETSDEAEENYNPSTGGPQDNPHTGDSSYMSAVFLILIVSGVVGVASYIIPRRKDGKSN